MNAQPNSPEHPEGTARRSKTELRGIIDSIPATPDRGMGFIAGSEQRGRATDMFRRVYWDAALSASDPVFRMLRDVAGIAQVLFGTDFPYLRRDLAVSSKQRILQSSELNNLEKRAILGENAARLFPRLSSVAREM